MRAKKMIVVGEFGVGKTSLVNRLTTDELCDVQATSAPTFSVLKINDIAIQVWDTAGQERFRSIIPQNSRNADVILVCHESGDPLLTLVSL